MSNWVHVNCCARGEFTEEKLEELFGKPILNGNYPRQFIYGSKKYKEASKKVCDLYGQSKLPCGEHPLYWKLYKQEHYHHKKNTVECFGTDEDVLIIWGDLRWFDMTNEENFTEIKDIAYKILNSFPVCVRQLVLQAYEEYSEKIYTWNSAFNSEPALTILDKPLAELPVEEEGDKDEE